MNWKKASSFDSLNLSDETVIERRKAFLDLFRKYDVDKGGAISKAEFSNLYNELVEVEIVSKALSSTFEEIDVNSGKASSLLVLRACMSKYMYVCMYVQ